LNFPFYIAKRYLLAKKTRNAINIISAISVGGVMVGTMALVIVLSVFNGFDKVIKSLISSFDPDLKIKIVQGKTFNPEDAQKEKLLDLDGVFGISEVLEENTLLRYDERQYIATMKGVDDNYVKVTGIDSMIIDGDFVLENNGQARAVLGQGIAYFLRIGLTFTNPLLIYVPERTEKINFINPTEAFNKYALYPSGIFSIEQEYDAKYVILPIHIVRNLLNYNNNEVTALEVKISPDANPDNVKENIKQLLGNTFEVKTRFEQNEVFYRIMKSEKWAIFMILTLIILVASFNIIGSLTMLIIDKKDDIATLGSLGANSTLIKRIFLFEGWLISITGSFLGIILGTGIALIQEKFGLIRLGGTGSFVIDAYPVDIQFTDIILVWITVLSIGYLSAIYPVSKISSKYLKYLEIRQ
jgi:lipoprotein-releasing system permease protein